jgi:flagellar biosynthesis protein FlhG
MAGNGKARRVAIISGKGGVGKTVLTANIAGALSSLGRRVLVVDADLGLANLDIILGLDPEYTIQDVLQGKCPLEKIILHAGKGFDLLPAGSGAPEGTVHTRALEDRIESILQSLESRYDIMLFDAGAGIGDIVMLFAAIAHETLLVTTPEPASLMDAYATIKILNQVHHRNRFLLVVNQASPDAPDRTGMAVTDHLRNVISRFLESAEPIRVELLASVPQDPAIPASVRKRRLLLDNSPQAPSALHITGLAGLLDQCVTGMEE